MHRAAYQKVITERSSINICPVRLNHLGIPRSGKTSFLRRLTGVIVNLYEEEEWNCASSVFLEVDHFVVIESKVVTNSAVTGTTQSKAWSYLGGFFAEARMLIQFIDQTTTLVKSPDYKLPGSLKLDDEKSMACRDPGSGVSNSPIADDDIDEMFSIIGSVLENDQWDAFKYVLEDFILLINTDTGGQAEFLDLQASLMQGPSFNLLYSRLVDDLDSHFKDFFVDKMGRSTQKVDSSGNVTDVLFQTLSSIACASGCFSGATVPSEVEHKAFLSKVMFVGTHLDKVTEEHVKKFDRLLQQKIRRSEFFDKGIVESASEDQMMLAVNNYDGDKTEIDSCRQVLERVIHKNFEKVPIPVAWLMLSLYIRKKRYRTITLEECRKIASKVGISSEELEEALWFLHHRIGALLYYPEVESLKDTVICEVQVLYDSASRLITSTYVYSDSEEEFSDLEELFSWSNKKEIAAEKEFRKKAQFSMKDMKEALYTDELIPLEKLVDLLEHLNILTTIVTFTSDGVKELKFFMPCMLLCATPTQLSISLKPSDPALLLIRYECGYVPMGMFPAMITNLVSQKLEDWDLIEEDLYKNRVAFRVGEYCDTITLLSFPKFLEIAISFNPSFKAPPPAVESLCAHVRGVIQSTLHMVTTTRSYPFDMAYQFGFECPLHPGREHLCMVPKESTNVMHCLHYRRKRLPLALEYRHRVWFADTTSSTAGECIVDPH